MNSVIICEGATDSILLYYYMQKVYGWSDAPQNIFPPTNTNKLQNLMRGQDILTIMPSGGSSHIIETFENVLKRNWNTPPAPITAISKIVIIRDNDEPKTLNKILDEINNKLTVYNSTPTKPIINNDWTQISMNSKIGTQLNFELLLMVIPFEENGAMETCLLNAIGDADEYDKQIIKDGNAFVENADPAGKYLIKERYKTKAKFHVYFCIRGPIEQSTRSQQILMNVHWEQYPKLQKDFKLLGELGTEAKS